MRKSSGEVNIDRTLYFLSNYLLYSVRVEDRLATCIRSLLHLIRCHLMQFLLGILIGTCGSQIEGSIEGLLIQTALQLFYYISLYKIVIVDL